MTGSTPAGWLQFTLVAERARAPALEELLSEAGAVSVTLADAADDPLYEPAPGDTPLWAATAVTGMFPSGTTPDAVREALAAGMAPAPLPPHRVTVLEERDWTRAWMDRFAPMRFGHRLWVCPSDAEPPDPDGVNVRLDPGLAFGSGTHPTTALCLEWLDGLALADARVLDFGCGSGILAIAAILLGARSACAVDTDPQALVATAENARRNGVGSRVRPLPPEGLPDEPFQVLVANILARPLVGLAPEFARRVAPGGQLALSGILPGQAADVARAHSDAFHMEAPVVRDGWVRLEGRRREVPG